MFRSTTYMSFENWCSLCAAVINGNKVNSKRRVQYNERQIYLCNIQKDFQQVTNPTGFIWKTEITWRGEESEQEGSPHACG